MAFFNRVVKRGNLKLVALATGVAFGSMAAATSSSASDITFAVIGPHEYELPVNFEPFNAFVQYGEWNRQNRAYDAGGRKIKGAGGDLFVGLSKYVRFFTVDALPNVGLAFEVIVPQVGIRQKGDDLSGIGDPLTGFAVWYKPNANSTLGIQSFVQIPIGGHEITNDYWANLTSVLFDYQWEHVSLTGDIGGVFRSNRKTSGLPDVDEAPSFHTNLRLGWKNKTIVEPFLAFDYQSTGKSKFTSGGIFTPASDETTLGAGLMLKFSPTLSLTARYSRAVDGRNVTLTNGAYFKLAYVN